MAIACTLDSRIILRLHADFCTKHLSIWSCTVGFPKDMTGQETYKPPVRDDLTPASLDWQENGLPVSRQYADIYFSTASAIGEARHVFLSGNSLESRWQTLTSKRFTIAECGFGSGLNFLCAWQLWQDTAPCGSTLHYLGFELHPLVLRDLKQIHRTWPQLGKLSEAFMAQLPPPCSGLHRLQLGTADHPVILDLYYGDVTETIKQVCPERTSVDAWFLDGFSPKQNPAMWSGSLCRQMAKLSHDNTTLSTYSVASHVRGNLTQAGFEVEKSAGFGRKRHMLRAWLSNSSAQRKPPAANSQTPWFSLPPAHGYKTVAVIGSGLAGSATAHALARRGFRVEVFERAPHIASGASGNPQGILHLKPARRLTAGAMFQRQAYLFASSHYRRLTNQSNGPIQWHNCGFLQLARDSEEQSRQHELIEKRLYPPQIMRPVSAGEASELAGLELKQPGLFFSHGGWLNPAALCQWYLSHPGITVHIGSAVTELARHKAGTWHLHVKNSLKDEYLSQEADCVVIAGSFEAGHLSQCSSYPLFPVRGQISRLPFSGYSKKLQTILCTNGYIIPAHDGLHSIGGSFTSRSTDRKVSETDRKTNLQLLRQISPELHDSFMTQGMEHDRAGIRCTTTDHLPLLGPLDDENANKSRYAGLLRNASATFNHKGRYFPGLFVNLAHGSHGISTTPLAGEYLACLISGEPLPLQQPVINALHPARFLIRRLKKQISR